MLTQDNGIMLAYRDRTGASDEYRFAHLNHDDPSVVLDWVNTLLYMKYCILRQENPQSQDKVCAVHFLVLNNVILGHRKTSEPICYPSELCNCWDAGSSTTSVFRAF